MNKGLMPMVILMLVLMGCQTEEAPMPTITPTPFIGNARVELGDITMYFEAHGAGQPLLLLHGGFGSAKVWVNQIPLFSENWYVITPDSRGQGRTTDSNAPLSYHLMAEDMVRLMDHLGINSTYIVGWSDGGIIGIDIAIYHPERVKALVAFGANTSTTGYQDGFLEYIRTVTVDDLKLTLGEHYIEMMPDPEHFPIMLEKIRRLYQTEPNFTQEQLASIQIPTLILDGQNETVVRLEHTQAIASSIPNAELVILPDVGHAAVTENPDAWNRVVLDFLERQ